MTRQSASYVVDEINEILRRTGWACMTLPWPHFYELCGRERLKESFLDDVRQNASSRFQLIVAYGRNAVVVCHDRNFADVDSE